MVHWWYHRTIGRAVGAQNGDVASVKQNSTIVHIILGGSDPKMSYYGAGQDDYFWTSVSITTLDSESLETILIAVPIE